MAKVQIIMPVTLDGFLPDKNEKLMVWLNTLVEYFSSDSQMNWSFTCFQYHTKVGKT